MDIGILIIFGIVIYFVPTMIGWNKKHADGIIAVNLFLGWTLLGWVGALAWAFSSPSKLKDWHYICPKCGYKHTLNQVVKVYVCPQCKKETPIEEFENS